ncbi:uncharacterized protein LOC130648588 [Hydractinia symbiolongicarpus]|uniref:uncharacterized protein LOC130648588 n=1 Tax=Hydractinia symbiolongicarpus TaxID=13093 RepID=UPI00254B8151|nr:uncharacterized protein LOC130648588 [Hydractinia symbiolongicarpus]
MAQHLKGIFAGCTLSIILFLSGINVVLEYTLATSLSCYITSGKVSLPLIRAFMDDNNLMSSSVPGTNILLDRCVTALSWARMDFRAEKSRSFFIIKGRSINSAPFSVIRPDNETVFSPIIPSIHNQPVRFLGRIINSSISDRKTIDRLEEKLLDGLSVNDKSLYTGPQKLWILQHHSIPRIHWPLLIDEVVISTAARLEQKVSRFIRKWLNLHHSITNISLHAESSPCPLPIKSLTSTKISGYLLLRHSKDPILSALNPTVKAGTWRANEEVDTVVSELNCKAMVGPIQYGKAGIGVTKRDVIPPKETTYGYRKLVSETSKEIEEESYLSRALQLLVQGQWTRWENYVKFDLSWKDILATPPNLLSFCLQSTYDVLPSPNNLKRWKIITESVFCATEICTFGHILGACKIALVQGRYTFRHDSVLVHLVDTLKQFLSALPLIISRNCNSMVFVKGGAYVSPKSKTKVTACCFVISQSIELTCPCEENANYWHSTKVTKYSCLVNVILSSGWQVDFFAVEVRARGYCARTTTACLKRLGFSNKMAYSTAKNLGKISMTASFCVWIARGLRDWSQDPLIKAPGTRKTLPPKSVAYRQSNPAPVKEMPKGRLSGPHTPVSLKINHTKLVPKQRQFL